MQTMENLVRSHGQARSFRRMRQQKSAICTAPADGWAAALKQVVLQPFQLETGDYQIILRH